MRQKRVVVEEDLHRCWVMSCHRCRGLRLAPGPDCSHPAAAHLTRSWTWAQRSLHSGQPWCEHPPASPLLRSHSRCRERTAGPSPQQSCPVPSLDLSASACPLLSPPAASLQTTSEGWRPKAGCPDWARWRGCFQVCGGKTSHHCETRWRRHYWSLDFHCRGRHCWIQGAA